MFDLNLPSCREIAETGWSVPLLGLIFGLVVIGLPHGDDIIAWDCLLADIELCN